MERTIHITGQGKVKMVPDVIIISFDVMAHEMEYQTAIEKLNKEVNTLRTLIEENGLRREDLKTTNFSIHRNTKRDKYTREQEFNGFTASHDLKIRFKLDQELINKILLAVAKKLVATEFRISYSTDQYKKYEEELIKDAIKHAKRMAILMANESEVQLKEIINIDFSFSELRFSSRRSSHSFSSEMLSSCSSAPDIEPEEISLNENVNITWRIE
jgi:uncharacterized protein YggE